MPKLEKREFIQCVMCHRLVDRGEVTFLRVRVSHQETIRVPVCRLCQVDPGKVRFYIAQQRKKP